MSKNIKQKLRRSFTVGPCYVGPLSHSMACPHDADRADCLPIQRVAANTLNKQLQTVGIGWSIS